MFTSQELQENKGFSLVEFVVVLTIFAIMSSVAIFNYSSYRRTIEQKNVAQDIALSIRQAQLYGISAGDGVIGNDDFFNNINSYNVSSGSSLYNIVQDRSIRGVSINQDSGLITLFADNNRDFVFKESDDRVIDQRSIVSSDISIDSFCFDMVTSCGASEEAGIVDITFTRPYTDAVIAYRSNSADNSPTPYSSVALVIAATDEDDMQVNINALGRISVE